MILSLLRMEIFARIAKVYSIRKENKKLKKLIKS
jgi:hypothetical protein